MPAKKKDPEAAKREKAVQDLAELSEELGLYDVKPEEFDFAAVESRAVAEELRLKQEWVNSHCPFCGLDAGSCGHNPGGPA